jgi:hypothetical protein
VVGVRGVVLVGVVVVVVVVLLLLVLVLVLLVAQRPLFLSRTRGALTQKHVKSISRRPCRCCGRPILLHLFEVFLRVGADLGQTPCLHKLRDLLPVPTVFLQTIYEIILLFVAPAT